VKAKKGDAKKMKSQSEVAIRASISFPPDIYESLEIIAREKKVSLAWVVREAAEQYIGDKWPLFNRKRGERQ
jgi:predicted DNA-binding protein